MVPLPSDVRVEGLAIGLLLTRPATEADVDAARDLLDAWLDRYDDGTLIGYGNCGVEGEVGARTLRLWCDRLDDRDGHDAAIAHARSIAARARQVLPIAGTKLDLPEAPSARALRDRLAAPQITVRPGGDLVGDLMTAGVIPRPPGLRPRGSYFFPVAVLALVSGWVIAPPNGWWARAIVTALGVGGLALASARWCSVNEHALAALVVLLALAQPLALGAGAGTALVVGAAEVIAVFLWVRAWAKRR